MFALFVLRRREPNAVRPFKALGYPLAPAIFTAACFIILANALYTDLVKPMVSGHHSRPVGGGLADYRAGPAGLLVVCTRAISVTSASTPSLAANSRNDRGEPRST